MTDLTGSVECPACEKESPCHIDRKNGRVIIDCPKCGIEKVLLPYGEELVIDNGNSE